MSTAKDMTKTEFKNACERHGFRPAGVMGYYSLPGSNASVSIWNAGCRRRDQLAYLIREQHIQAKAQEESPL